MVHEVIHPSLRFEPRHNQGSLNIKSATQLSERSPLDMIVSLLRMTSTIWTFVSVEYKDV